MGGTARLIRGTTGDGLGGFFILVALCLVFATASLTLLAIYFRLGSWPPTLQTRVLGVDSGDLGLVWERTRVLLAADIQQQLLDRILGVVTWGLGLTWLIGTGTALALCRAIGAEGRAEVRVRRAVGASIRQALSGLDRRLMRYVVGATGVGLALGLSGAVTVRRLSPVLVGPSETGLRGLIAGLTVVGVAALTFLVARAGLHRAAYGGRFAGASLSGEVPPDPFSGLAVATIALASATWLTAGAASSLPTLSLEASDRDGPQTVTTVQGLLSPGPERGTPWSDGRASVGSIVGLGRVAFVLTQCGRCRIGSVPTPYRGEEALHVVLSAEAAEHLGLVVTTGRGFGETPHTTESRMAWVNEWFAERNFEAGDAVGRKLRLGDGWDDWLEVAGIVQNGVPRNGFGALSRPRAEVYLLTDQTPLDAFEGFADGTVEDATVPVQARVGDRVAEWTVLGRAEHVARSQALGRWSVASIRVLSALMTALAIVVAASVMRLSVLAQRDELGLLRALGARQRDIRLRHLSQLLRANVLGTLFGGWSYLFFRPWVLRLAGNPENELEMWMIGGGVVAVATLLASTPATIALARIEPADTLRQFEP